MKTRFLILATAMLVPMLTAAGCHHQAAAPTSAAASKAGILVTQARLMLPAVNGNPGAAYFTLNNGDSTPATLVGVDVTGAQRAEMHQTSGGSMQALAQLRIDPGQQVVFAPGGKHVMVFSLAPSLTAGGTTTIVLHFQGGKSTSAPLQIDSAGASDDMAGMAGMNMGGKP